MYSERSISFRIHQLSAMFNCASHVAIAVLLISLVTCIPLNQYSVDPVLAEDFNSNEGLDESVDSLETVVGLFSSSKLAAVPSSSVSGTLRYRIGKRVSNDRLVSHNSEKNYWVTPQNVTLILQYPTSGTGAIVTYVEVIVDQSSNLGAARVIAGGIGKRFIASVIEGNHTYWFNYSLRIYGI